MISGAVHVSLPLARLSTHFSRSSGAGGQNVNKLNTKAEVRFVLAEADWMPPEVQERFAELYSGSLNNEGEVYVTSQRHRTQERNLADALEKLTHMVRKAATVPKVRQLRTALSELSKAGYREDKRHQSAVKQKRKGPSWDEDD